VPVDAAEVTPIRLGDVVRSNLWIILLTSVLGLGLGLAAASRIDEQSSATAKILLTPLEGNPFYPSSRGEQLVNLETEAQALRSTAVATLAKEQLDSELSESELLAQVDVSVPVNTQILEVTFTAGNEDTAVAGAQAFADSYLAFRQTNAQELIDEQTAELDQQIAAAEQQLTTLATELSTLNPNSARGRVIVEEMGTISSTIASLTATSTDLTTRSTQPGELVTPAAVEGTGPITPKGLLPILGLLFGAALGLLIGLVRSRSDDRVREPSDVLDLGVTLLGTLAWDDPASPNDSRDQVSINDDEYRKLRVAVLALEKKRPFTLVVASATSESTGPLTVVNLSTSLARAGLDTVVIDATSRGRGPATVLDPDNHTGLAEVLLGDAVLTEALSPVAPLLWVLPPGDGIGDVADMFVGGEMARLIEAAKDHCDVVVVATDTAQQGVAQSLADMSDAVIVETEQDRTTRAELERAARTMALLGGSFLGTVFLGRDAAARTQAFRPHLTVNQRQLPPGPFAVLGPSEGDQESTDAAAPPVAGPAEPPAPPPNGAATNGTPGRAPGAGKQPGERQRRAGGTSGRSAPGTK
jgi:Mrp family chromosome partitioning ATPase/capsular polysaccharide biosynthesis protein